MSGVLVYVVLFFIKEAENLRTRYNDGIMEKQRLDQEVASLRRYGTKQEHHSVKIH
jgi:hypothetical protein